MRFGDLLREQAARPILDSDSPRDLASGVDLLRSRVPRALAASGLDRAAIMRLYANQAFEALQAAPGMEPPDHRKNAERIPQEAMRPYGAFDPPDSIFQSSA